MSDPGVRLQANFKLSTGDLFNIYGVDEEDFAEQVEAFGRLAGKVVEVGTLLRTASGVSAQMAPPPPAQTQAAAQQPSRGAFTGGAQMCAHGMMSLKTSSPDSGRKWSAYFCPAPKGTPDQCKPIDAKTGKPWG